VPLQEFANFAKFSQSILCDGTITGSVGTFYSRHDSELWKIRMLHSSIRKLQWFGDTQ